MTTQQLDELSAMFPNVDRTQLFIFVSAAVHAGKRAVETHGESAVRAALETREGMESLMRGTKSLLSFWLSNLEDETAV